MSPPVRTFRRVCVYCGSSNTVAEHHMAAARATGRLLAERGITVVYGGGQVGLMGAVADAALQAGGEVIGVIPEHLHALELGHPGCTELFVVDSMHTRKMMMAQLSDAFIALPGGFGTMEELFEATTWTQLNIHDKPVGVLNTAGYYDHLLAWLEHARTEGFIKEIHKDLLQVHDDPHALYAALSGASIPDIGEWIHES